jgi:hypothetical protein
VKDAGSSSATGTITVDLFVSGLSVGGVTETQLLSRPESLSLKPFKSKNYGLKIKFPGTLGAGRYFLFAQLDSGTLRDLNPANNIVSKGPFAIA